MNEYVFRGAVLDLINDHPGLENNTLMLYLNGNFNTVVENKESLCNDLFEIKVIKINNIELQMAKKLLRFKRIKLSTPNGVESLTLYYRFYEPITVKEGSIPALIPRGVSKSMFLSNIEESYILRYMGTDGYLTYWVQRLELLYYERNFLTSIRLLDVIWLNKEYKKLSERLYYYPTGDPKTIPGELKIVNLKICLWRQLVKAEKDRNT